MLILPTSAHPDSGQLAADPFPCPRAPAGWWCPSTLTHWRGDSASSSSTPPRSSPFCFFKTAFDNYDPKYTISVADNFFCLRLKHNEVFIFGQINHEFYVEGKRLCECYQTDSQFIPQLLPKPAPSLGVGLSPELAGLPISKHSCYGCTSNYHRVEEVIRGPATPKLSNVFP